MAVVYVGKGMGNFIRALPAGCAIIWAGAFAASWILSKRSVQFADNSERTAVDSGVSTCNIDPAGPPNPDESLPGKEGTATRWTMDTTNPDFSVRATFTTIVGQVVHDFGIRRVQRDSDAQPLFCSHGAHSNTRREEEEDAPGASLYMRATDANGSVSIECRAYWEALPGGRHGRLDQTVVFRPEDIPEPGKRWSIEDNGSLLVQVTPKK